MKIFFFFFYIHSGEVCLFVLLVLLPHRKCPHIENQVQKTKECSFVPAFHLSCVSQHIQFACDVIIACNHINSTTINK